MQISAANLLLASQQPRATGAGASARDGAQGAFAAALSAPAAAAPMHLALPDLEAGAGAEKPSAPPAAADRPAPPKGYTGTPVPGAQLDIRV